jgi:hypothetical protein
VPFAKLFSSITESSLWSASKEARLLFVSMLARCDSVGFIEASIPGLARMANLTREEVESALLELEAPDVDSKSQISAGRRVVKVHSGWCLTNYEAYRARRSEEERREYMRRYMSDYRKVNGKHCKQCKPMLAQAEAEGEGEGEGEGEADKKQHTALRACDSEVLTIYAAYPRKVAKPAALRAIKAALKKVDYKTLLKAVSCHATACIGKDSQYIPHPATWFNQERWNDVQAIPSGPVEHEFTPDELAEISKEPEDGYDRRDDARIDTEGALPMDGDVVEDRRSDRPDSSAVVGNQDGAP